jgi:hypothetical protein
MGLKESKMTRLFLATLTLMAGCTTASNPVSETPNWETQSDGLEVAATIRRIGIDSEDNQITFYSGLRISNTSTISKSYSNSWLWLRGCDGLNLPTYSISVASQQIDVSSVVIPPNETMEQDVYWVLSGEDCVDKTDPRLELILELQS